MESDDENVDEKVSALEAETKKMKKEISKTFKSIRICGPKDPDCCT